MQETPMNKGKARGIGNRGNNAITLYEQNLPTMRNVILPLFLVALPAFAFASGPAKMLVVVHSTDRVVVDYVCNNNQGAGEEATVFRTEVLSQGGISWHVVGGVAPYRVIHNENNTIKGCITVMDAEGQIATGCSMIGLQKTRVAVDCQAVGRLDDGPYGLVPNDSTDKARAVWIEVTPTYTDGTASDDAPPTRGGGGTVPPTGGGGHGDIGYRPPVKTVFPDNPPPPADPGDAVKEHPPIKQPHTNPPPQPRPHNTSPGKTSPSVSPGPTRSMGTTGTSPRPSPPPVQRTPVKTNSTW